MTLTLGRFLIYYQESGTIERMEMWHFASHVFELDFDIMTLVFELDFRCIITGYFEGYAYWHETS